MKRCLECDGSSAASLEAGFIIPRLLGLIKPIPPGSIERQVPRAADVFLRGYATPKHLEKLLRDEKITKAT